MNIKISKEAAAWYNDELDLTPGTYLRFFVRYGGQSIQSGFSLGIASQSTYSHWCLNRDKWSDILCRKSGSLVL